MVSIATAVLPVWRSPMISSRWPRPTGISESMAFRPVCTGSCTDLRGMMPGALTSTRRRSAAPTIGPLPSIGSPRGVTTRPRRPLPTGTSTISERRRTSSPSEMARSSPKMTTPTLSRSRLRAMPFTPAFGNSTISPAWTLSSPNTRAMPSPTDSTWPTSETSASSPKLAICDLRMAEISAARMSMGLRSLQGELEGVELRTERSVEQSGTDPHLDAAQDGRIDAGLDFRILAERGAQGGGDALGLGGRQRDGGGHLGRDRAARLGGEGLEGLDHRRQHRGAAVGGQQAQELLGGGIELRLVSDGGQGAALIRRAKRRRGQQDMEVPAVGAHLLQRFQVGLHGRQFLFVVREIEQGLGISAAHIRSLGIVRHLLCPPDACRKPRRGNPTAA